jgi:hypothetical protein
MVRTTITPENTDIHISVPQRFVGKKVEVLLYTIDEEEPAAPTIPKNTMAKFWGVISAETGAELHKSATESRNEWDRDI